MKIVKALNNNMVLVMTDEGREMICQGKGIGFQKKAGELLDETKVERKFVPSDAKESRNFQELFAEIPEEYFVLSDQIVRHAKEEQKIKLPDKVILPICDHIAGSVERYKKGVKLNNPMLWDIKRIYPSEFAAGKYGLLLIKEKFGIEMKEDEAAFLASHFVNAELESKEDVSIDEVTVLISSIVQMVQEAFQIELNQEDWNYQRFLTHLRFFSNRVLLREGYGESEENELYTELCERYPHIKNCVNLIADYILIQYHYDISSDERLYLLIHIERVTKRYRKKK